jgi:hypothetical protein
VRKLWPEWSSDRAIKTTKQPPGGKYKDRTYLLREDQLLLKRILCERITNNGRPKEERMKGLFVVVDGVRKKKKRKGSSSKEGSL